MLVCWGRGVWGLCGGSDPRGVLGCRQAREAAVLSIIVLIPFTSCRHRATRNPRSTLGLRGLGLARRCAKSRKAKRGQTRPRIRSEPRNRPPALAAPPLAPDGFAQDRASLIPHRASSQGRRESGLPTITTAPARGPARQAARQRERSSDGTRSFTKRGQVERCGRGHGGEGSTTAGARRGAGPARAAGLPRAPRTAHRLLVGDGRLPRAAGIAVHAARRERRWPPRRRSAASVPACSPGGSIARSSRAMRLTAPRVVA